MYFCIGETLQVKDTVKMPTRRTCSRCGFVSSQEICKACIMLEGLNRGLPKLGIGKTIKVKRIMDSIAISSNEVDENKCNDKKTQESIQQTKSIDF